MKMSKVLSGIAVIYFLHSAYALNINEIPLLPNIPEGKSTKILTSDMNGKDLSWETPFEKKLTSAEILIDESENPNADGKGYYPVQKILLKDCRAVRGFINYPVDGRLDSRDYAPRNYVTEWPATPEIVSYGLLSYWMKNMFDGLHIVLDDKNGFNSILLRSKDGFTGTLLRDNSSLFPPWDGKDVYRFKDEKLMIQKTFKNKIETDHLSFVDKVKKKTLGDVSFLRTGDMAVEKKYSGRVKFHPSKQNAIPNELKAFFSTYFKSDEKIINFKTAKENYSGTFPKEKSGFVHFILTPFSKDIAIGGVTLDLKFSNFQKGEIAYISIQDPFSPRRELMGYNFPIDKNGELKAYLDFPDQIVPANTSIWVKIWTDKAELVSDNQTTPCINLLIVDKEQALAEYFKYRMFLFKGIFGAASEARPHTRAKAKPEDIQLKEKIIREDTHAGDTIRELWDTVDELKRLYPEDKTVKIYYEWIYTAEGMDMFPKDMKVNLDRKPEEKDVPEWALAAERNTDAILRVADWWIKNRQIPDGEFGGAIGDDTDLLQQFYGVSLMRGDETGTRIKEACKTLNDLTLKSIFKNGMHILKNDPLHGYEEGINTASIMPLLYYGDPLDFENLMEICRASMKLTVKKDDGRRYFRKYLFNHNDLDKTDMDTQSSTHFLYLHPFCVISWYNKNEKATEFVSEIIKGLIAHMKDGMVPKLIDVREDKAKDGAIYEPVFSMFYHPAFLSLYFSAPEKLSFLDKEYREKLEKRLGIATPAPYWMEAYNGNATGRIKRDAARMEHFEYIHTEAEIFDDRVFMDKRALYMMSMGTNLERNFWAPVHHATYEGFSKGFSAMLLETKNDRLKIAFYNNSDKVQEGVIRTWRLDNGEYSLVSGPDNNNDNVIDKTEHEMKDLKLARHSAVPVSLPPRKTWIVEMTQKKKADDIRLRPDLALSPREVKWDKEKKEISFAVHNIGAKASGNFTISLFRGDKKVQDLSVENIDAPLDLFPRKKHLSFKDVENIENMRIVIDPDNKIEEITEENNRTAISTNSDWRS